MSIFTILKLTEALHLIEDALFNEAIFTVAKQNNKPSRSFFARKIGEVFDRTVDVEDRINILREFIEALEEESK